MKELNTIGLITSALDASALRQKAISNNIANVDTPNYRASRVAFEEILQKEMNSSFTGKRTDERHFAIGAQGGIPSAKLKQENNVFQNSGNGVDIDYEMSQLSQNTIWYQSLTYGINEEFNLIKTAIRGRS
ncbi:flagellar basal body rod protein FlgB [Neobacillus sp. YIM B06451]|uniref:flagellar basal body rod protein FlgB n=1 Tax=Neobacillus sp. YIM B06451 TaxID=3070994 RepID=UPI00292DC72D|nr:flagellar basal body rod protein FlgB [Neobacillus sp. YIM B06451]